MNGSFGANEGIRVLKEIVCKAIPAPPVSNGNANRASKNANKTRRTVTEFRDKVAGDCHKAFQKWRKANLNGYFLNCRSASNALLHRVSCSHSGDMEWIAGLWGSLTKHAKVCSTDTDELRRWAAENGYEVSDCEDCRP